MITLMWKKEKINYESVEWSGSAEQSSRQITFTIPSNPYDKSFNNLGIKLGDLITLFEDKKKLFVGTITSREKTSEIGTVSYTAMDFMHHLLRSNGTYKFKDTTPERIAKRVCGDLRIPTGSLVKSNASISKLFFENASMYDIIIKAYRKVKAITKKNYMLVMDGKKVCVIEKGTSSGVNLKQGVDIINSTYSDTTDNIVNLVRIYNKSMKKLGDVRNEKSMEAYGVYADTYTKEDKVNAKDQAKSMLVGVTQEASVEALGDVRAVSGKSIEISDPATGLKGKFYITSDTHSFSNGAHTMTLDLAWNNTMEEGAESTADNGKKEITNKSKCYYLENSNVYHSSTSCSACKGKNAKSSTVEAMKKIKITSGANKGKRKYKPCSKCWQT